jgi:hypothetical protein
MADWRDRLGGFIAATDKKARQDKEAGEWSLFLTSVVIPAFEELVLELGKHGRSATVRSSAASAQILVSYNGEEEMLFRIQAKTMPNRILPFAEVRTRERKGLRYVTTESMFRSATPPYTLTDITKDEIIRNFVTHYTRRVKAA